jgi:hypothetical protein
MIEKPEAQTKKRTLTNSILSGNLDMSFNLIFQGIPACRTCRLTCNPGSRLLRQSFTLVLSFTMWECRNWCKDIIIIITVSQLVCCNCLGCCSSLAIGFPKCYLQLLVIQLFCVRVQTNAHLKVDYILTSFHPVDGRTPAGTQARATLADLQTCCDGGLVRVGSMLSVCMFIDWTSGCQEVVCCVSASSAELRLATTCRS